MVVKFGGFFGVSIKRGIKKSGKLLDLIDILGFSQELKDGILYCISNCLRGE